MADIVNLFGNKNKDDASDNEAVHKWLDELKTKDQLKILAITVTPDDGMRAMIKVGTGGELLIYAHYMRKLCDSLVEEFGDGFLYQGFEKDDEDD